jgi:hypothetical protein
VAKNPSEAPFPNPNYQLSNNPALTAYPPENNEGIGGSNPHKRGGTTSDSTRGAAERSEANCGANSKVVFKGRLCRLDLFCYFLPSREKSKEEKPSQYKT